MKNPILIFLSLFLFTHAIFAGPEVDELLSQGKLAFKKGDMEAALEKFELAIGLEPDNKVARGYLKNIKLAQSKSGNTRELENDLKTLILPKIEFRNASFASVLDYMKLQAEKHSEGKIKVNFVVQLSNDFMERQKLTLSLNNTPYTEILRYVAEMAGVKISIEKYAIVVKEL